MPASPVFFFPSGPTVAQNMFLDCDRDNGLPPAVKSPFDEWLRLAGAMGAADPHPLLPPGVCIRMSWTTPAGEFFCLLRFTKNAPAQQHMSRSANGTPARITYPSVGDTPTSVTSSGGGKG